MIILGGAMLYGLWLAFFESTDIVSKEVLKKDNPLEKIDDKIHETIDKVSESEIVKETIYVAKFGFIYPAIVIIVLVLIVKFVLMP